MAGGIPKFVIKPLIDDFRKGFFEFMPFLRFSICLTGEFHRIVINSAVQPDGSNSRLINYSQIKYPPLSLADKIPMNRASLHGQSIFYAGSGNFVATLETKFKKGDLYTHSTWKQKTGTEITYIPIFHSDEILSRTDHFDADWLAYANFLKTLDKNVAEVVRQMYKFLATIFSCKLDQSNKQSYLICALMADLLLNDPHNGCDCLYYPSVASDLASTSIALKPEVLDSKFELVALSESFCIKAPDDFGNGWLSHRTAQGINLIHLAKEITWSNQELGNPHWNIPEMMKEYNAHI